MNIPSVNRREFDELKTSQDETYKMVSAMHSALMEPQPGHEKALVERMAEVTIRVEAGDRAVGFTVRVAAFLAAIGAIVAFFQFNR